jgi:hypothetical protein
MKTSSNDLIWMNDESLWIGAGLTLACQSALVLQMELFCPWHFVHLQTIMLTIQGQKNALYTNYVGCQR